MIIKKMFKSLGNILYAVLFCVIAISCFGAFIYSSVITKSFKHKILDRTYASKEANIENLLVTETKDGQKLWELFADKGIYAETNGIVLLESLIGNIYENNNVKASFKSDKGTYNSETKQIILYDNVIMVYIDGTNIKTNRLIYSGKHEDIVAIGNVRIEKPNEAVVMGLEAVLSSDHKNFNIKGRTETHFYL